MGPEFPDARYVGHRHAGLATFQDLLEARLRQVVEFVLGMREQVAPGHVDCPAEQEFGIEPRRLADRGQPLGGVSDSGIQFHVGVHSPKISNVTFLRMNVYSNILDMVGQTPMLEVTHLDTGPCRLFLKLELLNPGGSIKDRIGISMIQEAEKRGDIEPGDTIVEATAGNTGLGLALVAAQKGYRLVIVLPDKMSQEKIFNLRAMGAEVILTRSDVVRGHPEYYQDLGQRIAEERGAYFVNQFGNPDNPLAHETGTAPEIIEQMDGDVDAIVLGVGSSGTVSGISKYLKDNDLAVDLILADPEGSILTDYVNKGEIGQGGNWLVEGIGEDFIPDIADFDKVTKAYAISDAESFATARELLRTEGVLAGSSSGTLLAAALKYCREQDQPKRVVTFACDTGNKYLSKLYNDFWLEDQGFISREQQGDLRDLIGRPHGERATITVGPTDLVTTAHNRLRNAGFSQLPVMEDGHLIGVITEDAIIHFVYGHPDLLGAPVRDAMESAFIKLDKSETLNNLVAMLRVQPYAAIMDGDEFLGLITRSDVLNYLRRGA
ncbi:MAG: pyridoxal-phosphate dependent enzyme [Woeseiaceae bacterium]